jgi:hypothetical protein
MLKKLRLFVIIAVVLVLAVPFNACQRLNGRSEDTIREEKEHNEENNGKGDKEAEPANPMAEGDDNLIPVAMNNGFDVVYGFTDITGKFVIEPRFKAAQPFFESGIAPVSESGGKTGLIDKTGKYIVEPQWDYLYYNEELFIGSDYENYLSAVFDKNGRMLFQREGYVAAYSEGLSPLYSDYERGYLDTSGNLALKLDYEALDVFKNGIAEVALEYFGPSHYIDKNGNDLTDTVSSGLRMYKNEENNLFGFKNEQGDIVINAEYYGASPFLNGYAVVCVEYDSYNLGYGIIDTAGNKVLEPRYCRIERLNNGLIAVGEEIDTDSYTYVPVPYFDYCKKALFTPDLKKSTDFILNSVSHFDNEYVCVNDDNSVYFINKDLEQARELPKLSGRGSFVKDGELLRGYLNGKLSVYDAKGNLLVQDSGDIELGDGILSTKQVELPNPAATFFYPVISGLKDKSTEKKINDTIYYELVESYKDFDRFNGPEDTLYVHSDYMITKEKNLILIDQNIYTDYLGAQHGYSYRNTIYVDSKTGARYDLDDLFKKYSGAWDFLSGAVTKQIHERMDEMGYFVNEMIITPDTSFALKRDGISIYYAEGDIAAYAAGMQEFFVPFSDLNEYIDTQGDFWNAFK